MTQSQVRKEKHTFRIFQTEIFEISFTFDWYLGTSLIEQNFHNNQLESHRASLKVKEWVGQPLLKETMQCCICIMKKAGNIKKIVRIVCLWPTFSIVRTLKVPEHICWRNMQWGCLVTPLKKKPQAAASNGWDIATPPSPNTHTPLLSEFREVCFESVFLHFRSPLINSCSTHWTLCVCCYISTWCWCNVRWMYSQVHTTQVHL